MPVWGIVLIAVAVLGLLVLAMRVVKQWERGVVLRLGRLQSIRQPGINFIIPLVDRMIKVDLRIVTMVLEPQEVITADNVTIRVDAVVYFMVVDPERAVVKVEDYRQATTQTVFPQRIAPRQASCFTSTLSFTALPGLGPLSAGGKG